MIIADPPRLTGSADRLERKSHLWLSQSIWIFGSEVRLLESNIRTPSIVSSLMLCSNWFCVSAQPCHVMCVCRLRPMT